MTIVEEVPMPPDWDDIADHADHELTYIEQGVEKRRVHIEEGGSITIGKSIEWDCDVSDIWCDDCARFLNLEDREWEFT